MGKTDSRLSTTAGFCQAQGILLPSVLTILQSYVEFIMKNL